MDRKESERSERTMTPEVEHQKKTTELTEALETLERQSRFITDQDPLMSSLRRMIVIGKRTALDPEHIRLAIARLDHAQQVTRLFRDANPTETECIQKARNTFAGSIPSIFPPVPSATRTETVQAKPEIPPGDPSLLEMAAAILQERRAEYGPVDESFANVARMWSTVLNWRITITSEQVALMMLVFKVCRHIGGGSRDDLVDICGYAELLDQLETDTMEEDLHPKRNRPERVPDQ